MNKLYVTSVNEGGYGIGVVPERDPPKAPHYYADEQEYINYQNGFEAHLASLPTLLIHPDLQPVKGTFIESWQEGYEDKNFANLGGRWMLCSKEDYDTFPETMRRKVAIPVTDEKLNELFKKGIKEAEETIDLLETGIPVTEKGEVEENLNRYLKPISDRINYFASKHHKYEAKELHDALNVILRLVPPSSLPAPTPMGESPAASTEGNKEAEWRKALISLTPGGSEFVDDPEYCVQIVREFQKGQHDYIMQLKKQLSQLPKDEPSPICQWCNKYKALPGNGMMVELCICPEY